MKKLFSAAMLLLWTSFAYGQAGPYVGDFPLGATVRCMWNTFNAAGASVTRGTNGTVQWYEDGGSTSESTSGVTDTEDFDTKTGMHLVDIVASGGNGFEVGKEYHVTLIGAAIDSQTVNAELCSFSVERGINVRSWNLVALATTNPLPNAAPGAANGVLRAGANTATSFTGAAASGATPATPGIDLIGGAASTTGGGTAAPGLRTTGGAGAASTNGAASGFANAGGGTTTVAGAPGVLNTGSGNLPGLSNAGAGSGPGALNTGGASGEGQRNVGGSSSGAGQANVASAGNSSGQTNTGQGTGNGQVNTSGAGATGNGQQNTAASTNGSSVGFTSTGTGLDPLKGTTNGRTLDVSPTGEAGIDWGNVGSPSSTVALTNTTTNGFTAAAQLAFVNAVLLGQGIPAPTTINTLASQTSFTLVAGSANDNAYNGYGIIIRNAAQTALGCVRDYTGGSKTVTLQQDPAIFTMAAADNVILLPSYCDGLQQIATVDQALVNCEVNTANFAGSTTTLACVLTDKTGASVTATAGMMTGLELVVLSGAQKYEKRFIQSTTASSGELRLTLSRALPLTLADAVTAIIR